MRRRDVLSFISAAVAVRGLSAAAARTASNYPERPVRLIIPFPPGGGFDAIGRPWADRIKPLFGTIVVENQGGGGSSLGAATVAHASPDGYTLLLGGSSTHVTEAILKTRPLYDPMKDLEPISNIAVSPFAVAVHPSVPATTLREFIDYDEANRGKLSYGHAGVGSINHLIGELFKSIDGLPDLLASYMLDADGLRRYAGEGPLNTDSNQRIAFDAASASDIERSVVAHRALASLLPFRRGYPDAFVRNAGTRGADALRDDVDPYAEAASRYLAAEIDRLDDRSKPMPDAALAGYLDAYAADVRFTLPIGKLLEYTLRDPARAREIVVRLATIHPTQPNVATLGKRLGAARSPEQTREIVERFLKTGGD